MHIHGVAAEVSFYNNLNKEASLKPDLFPPFSLLRISVKEATPKFL